ncbi:MAG: hypothetical protein ACRDY3_03020 [Acidimicrobiales bacterium]
MLDSLQLSLLYRAADSAADVAITLYDAGRADAIGAAQVRAEDCSAPPASQNANLDPVVEGPAISLTGLHAKVRRDGYTK